MRQPDRHRASTPSKRLEQLAEAIAAYRGGNPGRRLPEGLRAQVVAALDAGVSKSAIIKACKLSWSQVTGWHRAAVGGRVAPAADAVAAASPARVLSVVDTDRCEASVLDGEVELRIGPWRVSLRRAVD
jgi:hypothetical protein